MSLLAVLGMGVMEAGCQSGICLTYTATGADEDSGLADDEGPSDGDSGETGPVGATDTCPESDGSSGTSGTGTGTGTGTSSDTGSGTETDTDTDTDATGTAGVTARREVIDRLADRLPADVLAALRRA